MVNTYYEVRVDGDRTAAFGWEAPHQRLDAFRKARELINEIRFSFQKTKVLQIVDFKIDKLPSGDVQYTEQIIFEERPTVVQKKIPQAPIPVNPFERFTFTHETI